MNRALETELRLGVMREFLRGMQPTVLYVRAVEEGRPLAARRHRGVVREFLYVHGDMLDRHHPHEVSRYGGGAALLELLHTNRLADRPGRLAAVDHSTGDVTRWWEVWPRLFGGLRIDVEPLRREARTWTT